MKLGLFEDIEAISIYGQDARESRSYLLAKHPTKNFPSDRKCADDMHGISKCTCIECYAWK